MKGPSSPSDNGVIVPFATIDAKSELNVQTNSGPYVQRNARTSGLLGYVELCTVLEVRMVLVVGIFLVVGADVEVQALDVGHSSMVYLTFRHVRKSSLILFV